jgi:uncharacterized membrane protein YagU involved in acid resistance
MRLMLSGLVKALAHVQMPSQMQTFSQVQPAQESHEQLQLASAVTQETHEQLAHPACSTWQ